MCSDIVLQMSKKLPYTAPFNLKVDEKTERDYKIFAAKLFKVDCKRLQGLYLLFVKVLVATTLRSVY